MRVVIESKKVLVVESRGWRMAAGVLGFVLLHVLWLRATLHTQDETMARLFLFGSLAAYAVLAGLLFTGRLREKVTVTFHGAKHEVLIEREYPGKRKTTRGIPFTDFTAFEVSLPPARGFCRIRMKDGKRIALFRVAKGDDFRPLHHLDMMTRKTVERVDKA